MREKKLNQNEKKREGKRGNSRRQLIVEELFFSIRFKETKLKFSDTDVESSTPKNKIKKKYSRILLNTKKTVVD